MNAEPIALERPALGYWSLTMAMMGIGLAMGTGLPALALGLSSHGGSTTEVGLGVALLALGQVLALPVALRVLAGGQARRVLAFGLAGTAMGLLAGAAGLHDLNPWSSLGVAGLVACVLFTGLSLGVVFNVAETWVHELLPPAQRGRWVAVHCTLFTLAQLAGPLLLQAVGQGWALAAAAVFVALMGLGLKGLPACMAHQVDAAADGPPAAGSALRGLLKLGQAAPATLWATALFALFDTVVLSLLPIYLQMQGFSMAWALTSASVVLLGDVVMEVPVGWWADRWGVRRVQALCAVVVAVCALLIPWALPAGVGPLWWLLMLSLGGAAGGIYVLSVTACGEQFRGQALVRMTALLGAAWGAASCVGPAMAGHALGWGGVWSLPGLLAAGTALLLAGLWWEGMPRAKALRLRIQRELAPAQAPSP